MIASTNRHISKLLGWTQVSACGFMIFGFLFALKEGKYGAFAACAAVILLVAVRWASRTAVRFRFSMAVILLVGLILRILWSLYSNTPQTSDFAWFVEMVPKIAKGDFLLLSYKQTGPSIVGAFFYLLSQEDFLSKTLLLEALLSWFAVVAISWMTLKIAGRAAALTACLLLAFSIENVAYSNLLNCEVFQASLWAIAISLTVLISQKVTRPGVFLGIGLAIGMSQYMRGSSQILLLIVLFAAFIFSERSWRPLLIAVGFMFICLPILYINYRDLGRVSVSPSHQDSASILIGSHFESKGWYYSEFMPEVHEEIDRRHSVPNAVVSQNSQLEFFQVAKEMAITRIKSDPIRFIKMAVTSKLPDLWSAPSSLTWSLEGSAVEKKLNQIDDWASKIHALTLVLATLGFGFLLFRKSSPTLTEFCCVAILAIMTLVHMIVEVHTRYHYVLTPLVTVIAGIGVGKIIDSWPKIEGALKGILRDKEA